MEASISLKKIGKVLNGRSVLAGLSFGIERGSIMAVVGPNDSGKTALLKVIAGFSKPEYGSVFIDGMDVQLRRAETASLVGYMHRRSILIVVLPFWRIFSSMGGSTESPVNE